MIVNDHKQGLNYIHARGTVGKWKPIKHTLYIFSGLPGAGKSTLAKALARHTLALYVRIDTIEQGLRDLYGANPQGEGYRLAYRIALDNLRLGLSVVADSCNPIELTRREWEHVALEAEVPYVNIEVVCSDSLQHRARVECRESEVSGLTLPTWDEVQRREYHQWTTDRVVINTANRTEIDCIRELLKRVCG